MLFALVGVVSAPPMAEAQGSIDCTTLTAAECMREYALQTGERGGLGDPDNQKPFQEVVADILKGLFGFLGVIMLLLIMYGGFLWMTARGNDDQIGKAKKVLSNSIIGLFIVIIGYSLTIFIFDVIIDATNYS